MRNDGFYVGVVMIVLLSSVCYSQTDSKPSGNFLEYTLGPVPNPVMMNLTADKRHVFYVMPREGKKQVLINGKVIGPDLDTNSTFVERTFGISSDGTRTGYAVGEEDPNNDCHTCGPQGKWHAVIDGVPGPEYDATSGIVFSPDAKHVAYAAIKKKKGVDDNKDHWVMVIDGKEKPIPYDAVSRNSPVYSPDGKLVYIAKKGEKAVVVVDDKEDATYDKIKEAVPVFSRGGKRMAYVARNYNEPGDTVIIDGKRGPYFDNIPETSLVFSSDGRHFAYGEQTGGVVPGDVSKWTVVVDDKAGPQFDQVDNIIFSRDGRHVAYKAKKKDKWMLVVDGKHGGECESLLEGFPVFSPDSSRIAYGFKDGGTWKVSTEILGHNVNTGKDLSNIMGGEYGKIGMITFSPDGKHLAFRGINGKKKTVVLDGKNGPEQDMIDHIFFSPDGKHLAYEAAKYVPDKDDEWFMVVDGQPRPTQGSLVRGNFLFSKNSKHEAYIVSNEEKREVIIDGQASPGYKTVCQLLATDNNGFESVVIKGANLCRMVWRPQ